MKTSERLVGKIKKAKNHAQKTCGERSRTRTVPYLLFLDTSADMSRIAIFQGAKIIAEKKWKSKGDLSETLLVEIEKLLKSCKLKLSDLDKIAIFPGPGSYTGLRIGITCANFLAWSLGIPIFAAKVLDGKLSNLGAENQKFILPKYFRPAKITVAKSIFSK